MSCTCFQGRETQAKIRMPFTLHDPNVHKELISLARVCRCSGGHPHSQLPEGHLIQYGLHVEELRRGTGDRHHLDVLRLLERRM